MNTRNVAWGIVAVGVIGAGVWWMSRPAPAPAAEKPVVAAAAPAPKVAAPVVAPPKMTVAAPVAAPAKPAASAAPTATSVVPAGVDPELYAAADRMVSVLEAHDYNTFLDDFVGPGYAFVAAGQVAITPAQAKNRVALLKEGFVQEPRLAERFLHLAAALKVAMASPPQMNAAGDMAIYTIDNSLDKGLPPTVAMVRVDGKWVLGRAPRAADSSAQQSQ